MLEATAEAQEESDDLNQSQIFGTQVKNDAKGQKLQSVNS